MYNTFSNLRNTENTFSQKWMMQGHREFLLIHIQGPEERMTSMRKSWMINILSGRKKVPCHWAFKKIIKQLPETNDRFFDEYRS
jgi:hypothetical protein